MLKLKLQAKLLASIGAKSIETIDVAEADRTTQKLVVVWNDNAKQNTEYTPEEFRAQVIVPFMLERKRLAEEQNARLGAEIEAAEKRREDAINKATERVATKRDAFRARREARLERTKTPFFDPRLVAGPPEVIDAPLKDRKGQSVIFAQTRNPIPIPDMVVASQPVKIKDPNKPELDSFDREILD